MTHTLVTSLTVSVSDRELERLFHVRLAELINGIHVNERGYILQSTGTHLDNGDEMYTHVGDVGNPEDRQKYDQEIAAWSLHRCLETKRLAKIVEEESKDMLEKSLHKATELSLRRQLKLLKEDLDEANATISKLKLEDEGEHNS